MNGARALIESLVNAGVEVCFANPGTSEMHLVEAIDRVDRLRPVPCLFEGVCTGAADGYGRMSGAPAMTLLHLGAGLGNGIANLHNARRAATPVVNVVGDHALHHVPFDAPLTADIEAVARPVSAWVRTARSADGLGADGWDAVTAALAPRPDPAGRVATLIVPADCAWGDGEPAAPQSLPEPYRPFTAAAVPAIARELSDDALLLLDGNALTEAGLEGAARGCQRHRLSGLLHHVPGARRSWAGPAPGVAAALLSGADSRSAGPGADSGARGCPGAGELLCLSRPAEQPRVERRSGREARPELPEGRLSSRSVGQALAALAPPGVVVASDSGGGGAAFGPMQRALRHTWLNLTGGSIGQAGPVALGASLACPDRPVFALIGDGAAMYTNQFLWSAAREAVNLITVIYSNRRYGILDVEYRRLGINEVGARAVSLFDLSNPNLDWVAMARAQGVRGARAETCEAFTAALQEALWAGGPHLIEAVV